MRGRSPDGSCAEVVGDVDGLLEVGGKDGGSEAVHGLVGAVDHLKAKGQSATLSRDVTVPRRWS